MNFWVMCESFHWIFAWIIHFIFYESLPFIIEITLCKVSESLIFIFPNICRWSCLYKRNSWRFFTQLETRFVLIFRMFVNNWQLGIYENMILCRYVQTTLKMLNFLYLYCSGMLHMLWCFWHNFVAVCWSLHLWKRVQRRLKGVRTSSECTMRQRMLLASSAKSHRPPFRHRCRHLSTTTGSKRTRRRTGRWAMGWLRSVFY